MAPKKNTVSNDVLTIAAPAIRQEIQVYTPDVMLSIAVQEGRSLEEISKLMDLQDRWEAKKAKSEYLRAKSNFQFEVPVISKSKNVNFEHKDQRGKTNYNYAPLGDISSQIKEALHRNGLSYEWKIEDTTDRIKVTCIVSHVDGHKEVAAMEANADVSGGKSQIQAKGSTITYLQRYTLIGALGLTTADEDVDGYGTKMPKNTSGSDLPAVTDLQMRAIRDHVISGAWTVDYVLTRSSLTDEQAASLRLYESARNSDIHIQQAKK